MTPPDEWTAALWDLVSYVSAGGTVIVLVWLTAILAGWAGG